MAVVASLAWARLRHRPFRRVLVVLGVAAATVLPVLAQATASVAAAQALQHGIDGLPPGQRSVVVSAPGVELPPDELARMDRVVRSGYVRLGPGRPRAELLYRQLADAVGDSYYLGAADDLATGVRVTSGRLPSSCTPTRCEVVVVGAGTPRLQPYLGLVVVGRAVRTDPLLLTGTFDPGHAAPLLLAEGVAQAQRLRALTVFQRSYGWAAPLDMRLVRELGVDSWTDRSARTADELFRARAGLVLTSPDDVLRDEDARARLSAKRFTLLAGAATVVLLGFCLVAAIGLRRDQRAFSALLRRRGARVETTRALVLAEAAVPVLLGAVLGVAVGWLVALVGAARADLPVATLAAGAVREALPAVAVSTLAAVAVVAVALGWPTDGDPRTAWRVVDGLLLAGLATTALALARGTVGTARLSGATDPLLMALPVLVAACGGLAAARLWPGTAALLGRAVPHGWLGTRLALLGAARRPLRPVATVAFLTATTAVVVFAGSYRATLDQGAADQAAYRVPLTARVTTGTTLDRPLDVAGPAAYGALVPGAQAYPVVRGSADLRVSAASAVPVQLLGLEPGALPAVASWDHAVGGPDPRDLATALAATREPAGLPVPAMAESLHVPATGDTSRLSLVVWYRAPDGRDVGVTATGRGGALLAPVPAAARGGRLFAVTVTESTSYATRHQHVIGEGNDAVQLLSGRLDLGPAGFRDGGGQVVGSGGWTGWGSRGATVVAGAGGGLQVRYTLAGDRVVLGPLVAPAPLPALVDPATAARAKGGAVTVRTGGDTSAVLRVVGVAPRFPTTAGSFAVVDAGALAGLLDAVEPGTGGVGELWLSAPGPQAAALAAALDRAPYDRLAISLRAAEQARLATDPLAVNAARLLVGSALLAVLVAVVCVVLLVVADRRDEQAELYAWEADGVAPRTLRRSLFARAVAVVGLAVPAGLLVGLLLSGLTTALVTVTAVGTTPTPPLARAVGPGWAAGVLAVGLALAVGAAALVCAAALREPLPVRPEDDLR